MSDTKNRVQVCIRVPKELYVRAQKLASESFRTINQLVVDLLVKEVGNEDSSSK